MGLRHLALHPSLEVSDAIVGVKQMQELQGCHLKVPQEVACPAHLWA
jgi:hypothetical protein